MTQKKKVKKPSKPLAPLTEEEIAAGIERTDEGTGEEMEEETEPIWIETEVEAKRYVDENYEVPEEIEKVYVAQDGNVFYHPENESNAKKHAQEKGIKLFEVELRNKE